MDEAKPIRLFADFNSADRYGRLRLNCQGTANDLARLGIELRDGLAITVSDGDLSADGVVVASPEEQMWVVVIDRNSIRHLDP